MKSIRAKIMVITVIAIILSMGISTALGIKDTIEIGRSTSEQALKLLCENGEKNLDYYFDSVGQSVEMVASYAEADLESTSVQNLEEHVERVNVLFGKIARQTNGVLTYYYRIDPSFSESVKGFWYVDANGNGYTEHEVTDITLYDINDTTKLVWYTVPRASRKPVWIPPYITDNLDVRVISYNVPIILRNKFVGVVGIEIDYTTMVDQVNNVKLYENGYAFLNDDKGNIVYHPYIDVLALPAEEIPKTPVEFNDYEALNYYEFDGVKKIAVRRKLSNGMILNVSVPVSEIDGNWEHLVRRTIWISLGLLALFVFLVMQLAKHVSRPLTDLANAAKRVGDGDYEVELKYHGEDEVGILTASFQSLIRHLKSYISELNSLNQHLQEDNLTLEAATIRDSLTGVKNRFALRRDYDSYCNKDLHVMMIDIDDFKSVNDNYGHSVGDFLLKKMGDALIDNFGAEYSYRYGGDEFMVILPDVSEPDFCSLVKELEERLEEVCLEENKLPVHFSAGYVYGKSVLNDDLRLMLRSADVFLYQAKEKGKNAFIGDAYDREMAETIQKKEEESFRQG